MKLLLFSDVHRDLEAVRRLVERATDVDVAIGAGDFATCRKGLQPIIDALQQMPCPVVLVAGNAESTGELQTACDDWSDGHVLHGSGVTVEGVTFYGLGGAVPVTPFGSWSYDLTEDEATALLADCPNNAVLVTHSPPKGAVDRDSGGRSLGSQAVRATVERTHPRLVVCGHIHASANRQEDLAGTPIVNAGPIGIVWDLDLGETVA
ncbi:Calcineurin-like phosphoesterase superfamily domain protein [Maioricimonas rarisocia]|uniref:Calcineurin-like phosphoesterase superfamily domain protein n=1 Tax=Maioricimonas rarisocia TaxID=2528026 RepID=A0A517Z228_9PLAN|nr:metallophosphoesterase family protein [Maioricimonas rarisocia]QDU36527.1 Calcineurin-like phosphoesterase superfamily domain protein [Maioricimonas rarisocia]